MGDVLSEILNFSSLPESCSHAEFPWFGGLSPTIAHCFLKNQPHHHSPQESWHDAYEVNAFYRWGKFLFSLKSMAVLLCSLRIWHRVWTEWLLGRKKHMRWLLSPGHLLSIVCLSISCCCKVFTSKAVPLASSSKPYHGMHTQWAGDEYKYTLPCEFWRGCKQNWDFQWLSPNRRLDFFKKQTNFKGPLKNLSV